MVPQLYKYKCAQSCFEIKKGELMQLAAWELILGSCEHIANCVLSTNLLCVSEWVVEELM